MVVKYVSYIKGEIGIWKQDPEANIWVHENGEWRRLHNEEIHSLYHSPNIVRVIKSRRLGWTGHLARVEEGRNFFKILTGIQE